MHPRRVAATTRSLQTGALLGILLAILTATGLLLSPSVTVALGLPLALESWGNALYSAHLAAAGLLLALVALHLWPPASLLSRKPGRSLASLAASWLLLTLVLAEIGTGYVLWARDYRLVPKATAVLVHLTLTGVLLAPLAAHVLHAARVALARRAARGAALEAAAAHGRLAQARAAAWGVSRRAFLQLSGYAAAGVALAFVLGRAVRDEVQAWRINSVGPTPRIAKDDWRLSVTGLVGAPLELTYAQLVAMGLETRRFTHHCVEGWTYTDTFTGVPLRKVLAAAGGLAPDARTLIFKSAEFSDQWQTRGQRYTTNFPAQDGLADEHLLVVGVGGGDLPAVHGGPVRLMSPSKWGYKACKWLIEIEASGDASYRGYWERAGYHNDGDLDGPIFG